MSAFATTQEGKDLRLKRQLYYRESMATYIALNIGNRLAETDSTAVKKLHSHGIHVEER